MTAALGASRPDAAAKPGGFAARVLAWYDRHGRQELPWQRPATPYRVWVSEIMLQQTRVETVRPYFERFIARFPEVSDLAAAGIDEVLAHWAGLGYYARARNLHQAARRMVADHGGAVPADFATLHALPGIGRSTAGAILSLAHGQHHPILDGNVKRVLARHIGFTEWPGRAAAARGLWAEAEARTPPRRTGAYNQAMMDLGASVCLRRPHCALCPLAADCRARQDGTTDRIPAPKPRRTLPRRETIALVLQRPSDHAIWLERRPPTGIWGGLWSLPEFTDEGHLADWLASRLGDVTAEPLAAVEHSFTHYKLRIHPRRVVAQPAPTIAEDGTRAWYGADPAPGGLPAPIQRLVDRLIGATGG